MIHAHTTSIVPTDNPANVTLPDGSKVQSTHKCTLDLPDLPIATRNGHINPGLALNSLMVLYSAGCEVTFNKYGVTVLSTIKTLSSEGQHAHTQDCGKSHFRVTLPRSPQTEFQIQSPTYFQISN